MKIIILIIIFCLLLTCILTGCKNGISGNTSVVKDFVFKDPPEVTGLNLTDLNFDEIDYIQLETTDSALFTYSASPLAIIQLIVCDNNYIIQSGNKVLLFRADGKFERKLGVVGRGPDEFTVAHDVQYDEKRNKVYILAGWQNKFFEYSVTGELVRTFSIPFFCNQFRIVERGLLCYSENHTGTIDQSYNLIDTSGVVLKSYKNKYPFTNLSGYGILGENLFYTFNSILYKKEVYSDTIYSFYSDVFKPHIVISFGDSKLLTPALRSRHDGLYLANNYIIPLRLFEFGNYVYYEFFYRFDFSNSEVYGFIGSRNSDFHAFFDAQTGIRNDIDGGPNIFPRTIKDDRIIIAIVDAMQLRKHISSDEFRNSKPKYPEKKARLEEFGKKVKETDNPVLILVGQKNSF
jgi:hypothetical protein